MWHRRISGKIIQYFFEISIFGASAGQISGKLVHIWMSFPEIGLCHALEFTNNYFSTICSVLDEFSLNRSSSYPGNLPIRVNCCIGFWTILSMRVFFHHSRPLKNFTTHLLNQSREKNWSFFFSYWEKIWNFFVRFSFFKFKDQSSISESISGKLSKSRGNH